MRLEAVDFDPFSEEKPAYKLEAVDFDPFAAPAAPVDDGETPIQAPWQTMAQPLPQAMPVVRPDAGQNVDNAVRLLASGATLGTADKFAAGMGTAFGMAGDYPARLAQERAATVGARENLGGAAPLVEGAGGALGMMGLAATGLPVFGGAGNVAARALKGGGSMFGVGSLAGAVRGDDGKRLAEALSEGGMQGAVGAGGPVAGRILSGAWNTFARPVISRFNPTGQALDRVGQAVEAAGVAPPQLEARLAAAAADNQSMYAVADALGTEGRGALAVATKAPGPGREMATEFLDQRQAGQARRLADNFVEAFDAPRTARQTTSDLYGWAKDASQPFYEKALAVKPVWSPRLDEFLQDPITQGGLRRGMEIQRLEALAKGEKFDPTDFAVVDFNQAMEPILGKVPNMRTVNVIKKGLDNILDGYRDTTTGKLVLDEKGRAIDMVRRSFLGEVDKLNPEFAQARAMYAGPMEIKDAVALGRQASSGRLRTAEKIDQFEAMPDAARQGFRTGYVDPIVGRMESAAEGVNNARAFTSDAMRQELPTFARAGEADRLLRRIDRESEMFKTRSTATGGSQTAENLANQAEAERASLLIRVLKEPTSALGQIAESAFNGARGLTPEVREQMVKLLISRDASGLNAALAETAAGRARQEALARALGRGVVSGGVALTRANQ